MRFAVALLTAACFSASAHAEGPATADSQTLDKCLENAGGSDLAIKDCYVVLARQEDARLNRNWSQLMNAVGGSKTEIGAALLDAQRAWIAYRDLACQHFLVPDTTMERLMGQTCYTEIITDRADDLEQLTEFYREL